MKLNRTLRYLKPYIGKLSNQLQEVHIKLKKVGYYIADTIYDNKITPRLFILCKINNELEHLMMDLRETDEYIDDFNFDNDHHMIVILFNNENAFNKFVSSNYSDMYTRDEIESMPDIATVLDLGYTKCRINTWQILTKDPEYRITFLRQINDSFDFWLDVEDDRELDLPIDIKEEVLFE